MKLSMGERPENDKYYVERVKYTYNNSNIFMIYWW